MARLLASSMVLTIGASCDDRSLRPLHPCTTAGVQNRLEVEPVSSVDLLFMIDNSGSMREEQEKLRRELPRMVTALVTGDLDGDGANPGPRVTSLRVGIVTSDMGVGGVGSDDPVAHGIPTCGWDGTTFDYAHANYGDDGILRRSARDVSVPGSPAAYDCDLDANGIADSVSSATLPAYLTFEATGTQAEQDAQREEFVRRVACFANVGIGGCVFEQQLESVLKAVTPPSETNALSGGAFHSAPGNVAGSLGHGHGSDPTMDSGAINAGWFREDALLAIVLVTDEDDCSASDPRVFDFGSTDVGIDDPYDVYQAQTRCVRYEGQLVHPVERYVRGLLARRPGHASRLVFAAITGVPADLTDEPGEGVDNLDAILADPRMAVTLQPSERTFNGTPTNVPESEIAPACQHRLAASPVLTASADLTTDTGTLTNVSVIGGTPVVGMSVTGPGIQPGNTLRGVTGSGPYTLQLSSRPTVASSGASLTIQQLDVSAVPGRRIVSVARGLSTQTATSEGANAIVQSICVDDFRPAVGNILQLIQQALVASCLPRALIRNGADLVDCDVFVTLPEGQHCNDPALAAIYSQESVDERTVVLDGESRSRCRMHQIPVNSAATEVPPSVVGWYYDDFTSDRVRECAGGAQRIGFADGSKPPTGSIVDTGCLQPVQDRDVELDLGAPCSAGCAFSSAASEGAFALRYDLLERHVEVASAFRCEAVSNTCQIHCTNDSGCPGGYVCYDAPGAAEAVCVNPICGQSR